MAEITINRFPGIAPRTEAAAQGGITPAKRAHNVNLFAGILQPIRGNLHLEGGHSGPEFSKHNGEYVSGISNPIRLQERDKEILVYKRAGAWRKDIAGTEVLLGVPNPTAPILADVSIPKPGQTSVGTLPSADSQLPFVNSVYYFSWARFVAGKEVEGPLSGPCVAHAYPEGSTGRLNVLTEPSPASGTTIHIWNLYRSDNGDVPKLVSQQPYQAGYSTVQDTAPTEALGRTASFLRDQTEEKYRFLYVVTWERNTSTIIDESGPSNPTEIRVWNSGVRVNRPADPPTGTTTWNIYRISLDYNPTTEFQLVARVPVGTEYFEDLLLNEQLGVAIPTSSETSDGQQVVFSAPAAVFDGMSGPFSGMLFGWSGSTLYWSEPGKPDAWPDLYKANANSKIIGVLSNGGEVAIVTEQGVQRGIGTDPTRFYLAQGATSEGGLDRRATISCEAGLFYLSKKGIIQIQGSQARNVTDKILGSDYFNTFSASVWLEYHAGNLFLFDADGTEHLVYDTRMNVFFTISGDYQASFSNKKSGELILLAGANLVQWAAGVDLETLSYETGDIVLQNPEWKRFRQFVFWGQGILDCEAYIDDELVVSQELDLGGMDRDRTVRLPIGQGGRSARIRLAGTGKVTEIKASIFRAQP